MKRGFRDLAAVTALPSLCIGRTPEEARDILLDALPTVLSCDLVYLLLPGNPPQEHCSLFRARATDDELAEIRAAIAGHADGTDVDVVCNASTLHCCVADIPMGAQRGTLVAGRRSELDAETDRVLVRTAANLVGTIIENANVLDVARRKDDFLAILGHELRNPLAPIVTALDLLKLNASAGRERDVIERHTQHLVRIVDDLLDISRVTRGHVELRREHVSLASVLQRAIEIASPLLARNHHQLHADNAQDTTLQGDPIRLAQIFGNLLTNAAKFTPPGGRIELLVDKAESTVTVSVRDTGVGIAKDQLHRIFEPFVQADRARDVLRGGLGLGLAIVKNLVQRHDGTITAHSEGRGHGATFTVELPTVKQTRRHPPTAAPQPASAREQIRVLVVDDNRDIADLLSEALQSLGFTTAIAHGGNDAITRWRSFKPHVGVLDVGLPDLDGYGVARSIRSEYGAGALLIAVTGYGQPTDRERSSDAGFDCHMVKPISIHELVKVLDQRVVRS